MKKIIALLFVVLSTSYLYASSLEMALGSLKFKYNEYREDGTWFDSETNDKYNINGGYITYEQDLGAYHSGDQTYQQKLELNYSFHLNRTDYDGYLQNKLTGAIIGTYKGSTDNYLHQGHIRYKAINKLGKHDLGIFVGLGYRYWERDILGQYGFLETYQWPYYEVGMSWRWYDGSFFTGLDASYQKAYKPTMYAHTSGGLDFDLGDTKGYKFDIPLGYKINDTWSIAAHYIYDRWDIGRSNIIKTSTGIAREPDSETENQYAYLALKYTF